MNNKYGYKIVLIGDSGVGKTSLIHRFIHDQPLLSSHPTIGASFLTKEININNKKIKFSIWDTAGQERFRSMVKMYYKNVCGCLCLFDVSNKTSFVNVIYWLHDYIKENDIESKIIIVGNKCEVDRSEWAVTEQDVKRLADQFQCDYIFTSSMTGHNINELFYKLGSQILDGTINLPIPEPAPLDKNQVIDLGAVFTAVPKKVGECSCGRSGWSGYSPLSSG